MDLTRCFRGMDTGADPHAWTSNATQVTYDPAKPFLVIVIDDVSHDSVKRVLAASQGHAITTAHMPDVSEPGDLKLSRDAGNDVILHMPMEPVRYRERGIGLEPSTIKVGMFDREIRRLIDESLKKLNDLELGVSVLGMNNHMGSAAMQDPQVTDTVMSEMRCRGLLFFDSHTISAGQFGRVAADMARDAAARHGTDYVRRDVFLDHSRDPANIRRQFETLARVARANGGAIAIGHPHRETMGALKDFLNSPVASEFNIVPIGAYAYLELNGLLKPQHEQQPEVAQEPPPPPQPKPFHAAGY